MLIVLGHFTCGCISALVCFLSLASFSFAGLREDVTAKWVCDVEASAAASQERHAKDGYNFALTEPYLRKVAGNNVLHVFAITDSTIRYAWVNRAKIVENPVIVDEEQRKIFIPLNNISLLLTLRDADTLWVTAEEGRHARGLIFVMKRAQ